MKTGVTILVTGLVQGVGYRYFVDGHANRVGLVGFTRNLPSGEVEIKLEGERDLIEALLSQVRKGPLIARVKGIQVEWQDYSGRYTRFEIRY